MTNAERLIQMANLMKARDALSAGSIEPHLVYGLDFHANQNATPLPARRCKLCPSWWYASEPEFHRPECAFTTLQQHIDWLSRQPVSGQEQKASEEAT